MNTTMLNLHFISHLMKSKKAVNFLRLAKPDVYVKGGDYTLETMVSDERQVIEESGGEIVFIPFVSGKSTTSIINRMNN